MFFKVNNQQIMWCTCVEKIIGQCLCVTVLMYFHSAGTVVTLEAVSLHPQPTSTLASTTDNISGKLVTYIYPNQLAELEARTKCNCNC